jgi:succinyl-CoA synthetase beta subunit
MKLFEYQAKEILRDAGIKTPKSRLAADTAEVQEALKEVGLPCVIKAQVLQGGRGKAGLISLVRTEKDAVKEADRLFSLDDKKIPSVLVEQAVSIEKEIYAAITVDPVESKALFMVSVEGGVEIEKLAENYPEKIQRERVELRYGLFDFQIKDLAYRLGFDNEITKKIQQVFKILYQVFDSHDAELVEINPLFLTTDGEIVAGDAKIIIDENSMFRQKGFERTAAYFENELEFKAAQLGIPYLQFDGDISLMCAGAGLTTTVFDLIHYAGGTVANYLEFGGPNYRRAVEAMELCLENDSKVILIVTFGTIARADVMAEGLIEAVEKLKPNVPIVACIRGTNEERAVELLREAGLEPLFDTEEAVKKAVELAKTGGERA